MLVKVSMVVLIVVVLVHGSGEGDHVVAVVIVEWLDGYRDMMICNSGGNIVVEVMVNEIVAVVEIVVVVTTDCTNGMVVVQL